MTQQGIVNKSESNNHYKAEIFFIKPWKFFQIEVIINVLVRSFCFIPIPMYYGSKTIINFSILPVQEQL